MLCMCVYVFGGNKVGQTREPEREREWERKGGNEWKRKREGGRNKQLSRPTGRYGINIGAAPAESKSRSRWQALHVALRWTVLLMARGQQVPCVSSKGNTRRTSKHTGCDKGGLKRRKKKKTHQWLLWIDLCGSLIVPWPVRAVLCVFLPTGCVRYFKTWRRWCVRSPHAPVNHQRYAVQPQRY